MAGATRVWGGTVSTDKDLDANYVGGVKPAANDYFLWNAITPYAPVSGTWTNAVDRFEITAGAGSGTGNNITRDVGTSSSPFVLSAVAGYAIFGNLGNVYVGSTGTVAVASFEMPAGMTATLSSGTFTKPIATFVTMRVGASVVITNPWGNLSPWYIEYNATAITLFRGKKCTIYSARTITNGRLGNSRLTTTGVAVITALAAFDTYVNHQASGNATVELHGDGSFFTPANNPNTTGTPPTATIELGYGAKATLSVPGITLAGTITPQGPQYSYASIGGEA